MYMRELEEVDPASGGAAVHSAAPGCPSIVYMGTSEIRGQRSFYNYIHVVNPLVVLRNLILI